MITSLRPHWNDGNWIQGTIAIAGQFTEIGDFWLCGSQPGNLRSSGGCQPRKPAELTERHGRSG